MMHSRARSASEKKNLPVFFAYVVWLVTTTVEQNRIEHSREEKWSGAYNEPHRIRGASQKKKEGDNNQIKNVISEEKLDHM
jgi:hypothetical protein